MLNGFRKDHCTIMGGLKACVSCLYSAVPSKMPASCSIRALWIFSNQSSNLIFSRRFPTVEKQWQWACKRQNMHDEGHAHHNSLLLELPTDTQLIQAFSERKNREKSAQGLGLFDLNNSKGSDPWIDDPVTRHIMSLQVSRTENGASLALLWPLVSHLKGQFQILVLPLVEPNHLSAYGELCWKTDCGCSMELNKESKEPHGLSSIFLELPCITGSILVAKVIGDLIAGDATEPEVHSIPAASTGGLLDSFTAGMGISNIAGRAKPVAAPIAAAATAMATAAGSAASMLAGGGKSSLKAADKDVLRAFISSTMPFGTPLDLGAIGITSSRPSGFSAVDVPPTEQKQPAWKPYLYRGKQKVLFTVLETLTAALYDRDDVPDIVSLGGQVNCRADLEGLPDVSVPILCPGFTKFESFTFHPCCQSTEQGPEKQTLTFSPPLGNFVLAHYLGSTSNMRPPIQGFYQISMISENEGAFLFELRLMEGYKPPFIMEHCSLCIPFPRRKILSLDGNPSMGTISISEHMMEWKIVVSGRGLSKSSEVTFTGTVRLGRLLDSEISNAQNMNLDNYYNEELEAESEMVSDTSKTEDLVKEKMVKGDANLIVAELDEPFCWEAYSYAKASFKINGGTMSSIAVDSKAVSIYPATKVPCEFSSQVVSGDYIFWNTLGRYPNVATFEGKTSHVTRLK